VNDKKIIDKNYGSIPHLQTSKLNQQADKKITIGQEEILTKKTRDWKDLIIVTEKLDGSNVGIIKKHNEIIALTRSGYSADTSKYNQHLYFKKYVEDNIIQKYAFLPEGFRICGEWMIQSHGTKYDISNEQPFVAFDIFNDCNERILYINFIKFCSKYDIQTVPLIHIGQPISIDNSLKILGNGFYGKSEKPEGIVYRCEREGKVDFLAKWVRSDKEDGKYLDSENWNKGYKHEI
jgi:ATP-dependent RNA circularization protein (DNA/RNA ligase family)